MSTSYQAVGGVGLFLDKEFMGRMNLTPEWEDVGEFCQKHGLFYRAYNDGDSEAYVVLIDGSDLFEIYKNTVDFVSRLSAKNVPVSLYDIRPVQEIFAY